MTASLRVEIIRDNSAWQQLAEDWDRIYHLSDATMLQSNRFLRCWWQLQGDGKSPFIVSVLADQRLIGLVPLQLRPHKLWGKTYQLLEFMGMPHELARPTFLLPELRESASDAVFEYLLQNRDEWDLLQLEELVIDAPLQSALQKFSTAGNFLMRVVPFHPCPWLDLRQSWESYFSNLSKKMRRNIRHARNRLEKAGEFRFQVVDKPDEIDAALQSYLDIERRSWKHEEKIGVTKDEQYQCFYQELLKNYAASGQARILLLYLDDKPVTATISIQDETCYYSLQITHDDAYAHYSPGTVLESFELEALMTEAKFERYEFLGGALSNKLRWTESQVETERVLVHKKDSRTRLFDLWFFVLKPQVKALLLRFNIKPWDWPLFR
ncbi:MAG: GNAT family N-acetyltransferase [Pseudomonadales bacterium]